MFSKNSVYFGFPEIKLTLQRNTMFFFKYDQDANLVDMQMTEQLIDTRASLTTVLLTAQITK